jgi:DNA mismatch repair protein MutL
VAQVRRLPEVLVNQIAAGEVVERPSSVAKELVENALDAGAGRVEVVLQDGGRRRVRVDDDGCGMSPEDARLALERHATSKISCAEDLTALRTLGFRGEALPAIASVSRLRLVTSEGEVAGHLLEVEGGLLRRDEPQARSRGTTVDVQDLFFNTPARAKFRRAAATELQRCTEIVHACALAHPGIRFQLVHGARSLLQASPAPDLRARVRQIFGVELAEGLIPVRAGHAPLEVTGFVSRPAFSRASRAAQFVFVNGRIVSDRTLSHAIVEATRPYFPRDRFPALFLFLSVPPSEVDVNVHPSKREVRFRTPGAVHDLVRRAVEDSLAGSRPVQSFPRVGKSRVGAVSEAVEEYLSKASAGTGALDPTQRQAHRSEPAVPGALSAQEPPVRLLGQLRDTYLLVEDPEGLLLIDQHAAHERILYDRYREEIAARQVLVQSLLFPIDIQLTPAQTSLCEGLLPRLEELGFTVEMFGPGAFHVREVPVLAGGADPARLIQDLLDQVGTEQPGKAIADLAHRVAALTACHAAVRAGMRLDPERSHRLVADLLGGGHALTCPHGRPATLRYPLREIERSFLRT